MFVRIASAAVLCLILAACGAPVRPAAPDLAPVHARIQSWIDRGAYRGGTLIVVQHGRVICQRSYGVHSLDTVEQIASAGKWLAAATIMTLVDDGTLSLDDPAGKYLSFTDGKRDATIRQMLSHTSGYPPYQPQGRHRDDYQTLAESVAAMADLPPVAPAGMWWDYGGLGMQAAGRMAELASGKDWETLFQERIAKPCGMTATHFTPVDPGNGHSPLVGGGARSNARDYERFLRMIASGGVIDGRRVLSPRAIAAMQADQVGQALLCRPDAGLKADDPASPHGIYGLGEWRELVDAQGEAVLISSPSWAGAYPWIDKRHDLYGVFITHLDQAAPGSRGFKSMVAGCSLSQVVADAVAAAPSY